MLHHSIHTDCGVCIDKCQTLQQYLQRGWQVQKFANNFLKDREVYNMQR